MSVHSEPNTLAETLVEDGLDEPHPGELEQILTGIWKEVFCLEQISLDDNFFELGGNSLMGMELTELLAKRLAIEVPVLTVFQYPTIREMTEVIVAER
jgi:acyl carrier protein